MDNQDKINNNNDKNDIGEIFSRAYALSKINTWALAQGIGLIMLIMIALITIFIKAYDGGEALSNLLTVAEQQSASQSMNNNTVPPILSPKYQLSLELLMTVILAPLWTGVSMAAIASLRGQSPNFRYIISFYRYLPVLALASALVSILTSIGMLLLFIPGIYLFMSSIFTLPLIIEKNISPLKALILSIKVSNKHLVKLTIIFVIFLLLFVLVIFSFGFAYIWIGPLYFNVKAVLYQNWFCEELVVNKSSAGGDNNGVFDA